MKSIWMAFSMYSRLPTPRVEWDERSLSWALCAFPLVGVVIGAVLWGWFRLWERFDLGALGAAGAVVLPILISGGIHMDGFCDVCDALASHQPRERKLEILKDSSCGAFAVIGCGVYLLTFYGAWTIAPHGPALALSPVLSRCLSASAAVTFQNARGSGLLASFTAPMDRKKARVLLYLLDVVIIVAMGLLDGSIAALAAALSFVAYRFIAYRQFGGITGDTEGWFLQLCELAQVLAAAVFWKAGIVL